MKMSVVIGGQIFGDRAIVYLRIREKRIILGFDRPPLFFIKYLAEGQSNELPQGNTFPYGSNGGLSLEFFRDHDRRSNHT